MILSWIQQHALLVLLRNEAVRVKDLTPTDVPANLFSYHLEGLIVAGYVKKTARGIYQLTPRGESFAGSYSTETKSHVKDIKTVIMFYGKKDEKYLLFKWSRQPYLHAITLPHDRLAFGQTLTTGLQKAAQDKLGAQIGVKYKTNMMVKIKHGDNLISHMNALVYEVDVNTLILPFTSRNGELLLSELADVAHMKGLKELIAAIESESPTAEAILCY